MTAAIARQPGPRHPQLSNREARIMLELGQLPARRAQADDDEFALIEELRALGWSWGLIAQIYPPSPATGETWSAEGVRHRWLILDAKRNRGTAP